jgi:hypothetical protein
LIVVKKAAALILLGVLVFHRLVVGSITEPCPGKLVRIIFAEILVHQL